MNKRVAMSLILSISIVSGALGFGKIGKSGEFTVQAVTENDDKGSGISETDEIDGSTSTEKSNIFEYRIGAEKRIRDKFKGALRNGSQADDVIHDSVDIASGDVVIRAVGDCIIHGPLYEAAKNSKSSSGYNFDMLFSNVLDDIQSADIAIINQETIFIKDKNEYSSSPKFGTPTAVGEAEAKAGFDVITYATEHAADKGVMGITDTLDFWTEYNGKDIDLGETEEKSGTNGGVSILGIHRDKTESDIVYRSSNGIKIAFVNYTFNVNEGLADKAFMVDTLADKDIKNTLAEAESTADITIALLHSGTLYEYNPDKDTIKHVETFIDNGADIVIVTNPHVVQPYEMHKTKKGNIGLVYYSLGNFVSNQNEVPRVLGGMAEIVLKKDFDTNKVSIVDYDMVPLVTHQEKDLYTVYKLSDYTKALEQKHKLYDNKTFSIEKLQSLYTTIVSKEVVYDTEEDKK